MSVEGGHGLPATTDLTPRCVAPGIVAGVEPQAACAVPRQHVPRYLGSHGRRRCVQPARAHLVGASEQTKRAFTLGEAPPA
jgi:hypothetical protein